MKHHAMNTHEGVIFHMFIASALDQLHNKASLPPEMADRQALQTLEVIVLQ
jgi:hypothetical protein